MRFPARLYVLCKADDGAALIELALVTPILLLLTIGAVDLGRAGYVGVEVVNAAHAGAEYGSLNPGNTSGITAAAQQSAPNVANMTVSTPTWGCECSDGSSYSANCTVSPTCTANTTRGSNVVHRVQVTTSSAFSSLFPWPGIPSTMTLTGKATIRGN